VGVIEIQQWGQIEKEFFTVFTVEKCTSAGCDEKNPFRIAHDDVVMRENFSRCAKITHACVKLANA